MVKMLFVAIAAIVIGSCLDVSIHAFSSVLNYYLKLKQKEKGTTKLSYRYR